MTLKYCDSAPLTAKEVMNCDIATSMTWSTVLVFELRYVPKVLTAGIPAKLSSIWPHRTANSLSLPFLLFSPG